VPENYIREYMNTITAASFDLNLLNVHKEELRRKLGELETNYPGRIDPTVYEFLRKFFTGECQIELFRQAVSIKVRALRNERNEYL